MTTFYGGYRKNKLDMVVNFAAVVLVMSAALGIVPDQSTFTGIAVTLDGNGSHDPNGDVIFSTMIQERRPK